ncbi:transcription elongation factor SPT4 [Acrasis kona]|uniref:Transcription elongation factor SPT4 n=1 Tax=Acrasis kona TaxID=1008807 RepID=A0AAW2YI16_9EUKA
MSSYEDYDDVPRQVTASDVVPNNQRTLRACVTCGLIKSIDQFITNGCENCTNINMREDRKRVEECTSTAFEGMIALTAPEKSWVAKWQGVERKCKGMYAIAVYGDLPDQD